jgi:hypothetical protein
MLSPYAAIFDQTKDLAPDDKRRIGLATAVLILFWPEWLHRRVELVTFEDHDVIRRSNSFDFTLPRHVLDLLDIDGKDPINVAIPLTFIRKDELIHLNLSSEGNEAIPLLSSPQVSILSEAALLATAEIALDTTEVPAEIVCDIRRLVRDWVRLDPITSRYEGPAIEARERLFSEHEPEPQARAVLSTHRIFKSLAHDFSTRFIAAVLLPITADQRRVIHLAYDEKFYESTDGWFRKLLIILELLVGNRARRVSFFVSSVSDAASYHLEAEAPEGLQISSGAVYSLNTSKVIEEKVGSYQRIHFHSARLPRGTRLNVVPHLRPRSSTIVRAAALTSLLTMLGILYVWLQFGPITANKGTQGAAAALLVVPLLLSLYLVRTNEHPMTTHLLWPLRIVATAPGLLSLLAAGVLVSGLSKGLSEWLLLAMVVLLAISSGILNQTWLQTYRREHRR